MSGPIVTPFMFKKADVPIMSFQTDKNGTFDPSFTIASGTLKWVIDGITYITNSPSVALTGSTVGVEVFANGIVKGADANSIDFTSDGIIGVLNFSHFITSGSFTVNTNPDCTNIVWSTFANTATSMLVTITGLTTLDWSNVVMTGAPNCQGNSLLTTIIISFTSQTWSGFRCDSSAVTSLDFSSVTFTGGGSLFINTNPITSIIFKNAAQSLGQFRAQLILAASIDLSNFTITNVILVQVNPNLVNLQSPTIYGTGLSVYTANDCALNLVSVNEIFSTLNIYFSANAPTGNLSVNVGSGTNASPTGGASNTDLVNLRDVVYPNAGFTFTAIIN